MSALGLFGAFNSAQVFSFVFVKAFLVQRLIQVFRMFGLGFSGHLYFFWGGLD
jgi:hypothetical protein